MPNHIAVHRRPYAHYRNINSGTDMRNVLFDHAIAQYKAIMDKGDVGDGNVRESKVGTGSFGSVLTVCSTPAEAHYLRQHPFQRIAITGLGDHYDAAFAPLIKEDPRISFHEENAEALSFDSRHFDLVICKFGLHHLARPYLGLYEMLRCCRKAVILIEPWDSPLRRLLTRFGLTTTHEAAQDSPGHRPNFVFPINKHAFEHVLNSYYLQSGYRADFHLGWYSHHYTHRRSRAIRKVIGLAGWALQYVPGNNGNLVTAVIQPGTDLPPDPFTLGPGRSIVDYVQEQGYIREQENGAAAQKQARTNANQRQMIDKRTILC